MWLKRYVPKEGGIQVLAGPAPSSQTIGFLLVKPARKISQNASSVNSLQLNNTVDYFSLNTFSKVKNLTKTS